MFLRYQVVNFPDISVSCLLHSFIPI